MLSMEPGQAPRQSADIQGPVRILISSCLLGEKVRYDGGHKRDPLLVETLGRFFEYVPVCPELECGLPVPREPMRLSGTPDAPSLLGAASKTDFTEFMLAWRRKKLRNIDQLDLSGYICRKESPSCGMDRVKVYCGSDASERVGAGFFTKAFTERFPLIPVEEDGRLQDPSVREMFIGRVFTLRRFRNSLRQGKSRRALANFHADHKLLILSHGRTHYKDIGSLVARAKTIPLDELYDQYQQLLLDALAQRTTPAKCADVMTHLLGHLRIHITHEDKTELVELIDRYRNRILPMVVPLTMLRHYVRKCKVGHLERQVFLNPHPAELMLRNHV